MAEEWANWWRKRGDERLSLLLWAVWNPIGPVPLDEYASYTGQVVSVLRRNYNAGQELRPPGSQWGSEELVTLLEGFRCDRMGGAPNADADRAAARTLDEWYMWEMEELARRS